MSNIVMILQNNQETWGRMAGFLFAMNGAFQSSIQSLHTIH